MAKLTGPLLSLNAKGQIGKTIVPFNWRGIKAARQYVVPANPQTTDQTVTRDIFSYLSTVWKLLDSNVQDPWTYYAQGQKFYNRNAFMGQNVKALRGQTDLTAAIFSPGAKGGIPVASIAASDGGSQEIDVTLGQPTLPTGWTITAGIAVAMVSGDPSSGASSTTYAAAETSSPFNPAITAIAGTFDVWGFFKYAKADSSIAFGPSSHTTVTIA